jgi:hypothetical protein
LRVQRFRAKDAGLKVKRFKVKKFGSSPIKLV